MRWRFDDVGGLGDLERYLRHGSRLGDVRVLV